jgi:type VI protein secretion system component Hcp
MLLQSFWNALGGMTRRRAPRRGGPRRSVGRRRPRPLEVERLDERLCPALALTSAGKSLGLTLSTYADGFTPRADGLGPLAVAFPASGGVLVTDAPGDVRLFPGDGDGQYAPTYPPVAGASYGLNRAVGLANVGSTLYLTQGQANQLSQLNDDGALNRVVMTLPIPVGIVANPRTGHLFISEYGSSIVDVDPLAKTSAVFANVAATGLTLDPAAGVLYAATSGGIQGFDITTKAKVFDSGFIAGLPDGLALGAGPLAGNLFTNTDGGTLVEVNLRTASQTVVASGGSRGGFLIVDPTNGTLFLTQSDDILRVSPGDFLLPAQVGTTTALTSSVNPSGLDQPVTFTATVRPAVPGAGVPAGTVQFQIDGANFGPPVALTAGSATSAAVSTLAPGSHTVTAAYSGANAFSAGTAPALTQLVSSASDTVPMGLQLDSVAGPHRFGEIAVQSFKWDEQHPAGGSAVQPGDFQFLLESSQASPALFVDSASGQHIPRAVLTVRAPSAGGLQTAVQWTLTDVTVASFSTAGNQDLITLHFATLQEQFTPHTAGSVEAPVTAGYDFQTDKEVSLPVPARPGSDVPAQGLWIGTRLPFGVYLPLSAVPIVGGHAGGELAVQAFNWGEDRLAGGPAAQAHDFTFAIEAGQASPALLLAAAEGQHYGEAVFTVRRPGAAGLLTPVQWTLTDVTITSFATSASQEQITLHFATLQEQFIPDGVPGHPAVTAAYDFQTDKEVSLPVPARPGSDVPAQGLWIGTRLPFGVYLPLSAVPIVGGHAGGELAVQAFNWGEDRLAGGPAAQAHDFTFTIEAGQASPALLLAAAEGKHYGEAVFAIRKPTAGGPVTTVQWTLTDVVITSFNTDAAQDSVTLHFATLEEQSMPGGGPAPHPTAAYDFQTDTEVSLPVPARPGTDVPAQGLWIGTRLPFGVYLPLSAVPIVGAHAGGEVAVQSFSWGEARPAGAVAAQAHDFTFTIEAGQASPALFLAAAEGQHYGEAVFTVRRPGTAGLLTPVQWTLIDVTVTSFATSTSQEQITLHFATLQEQFIPDGVPGHPSVTAAYDFQTDTEVSLPVPARPGSDVPAQGLWIGTRLPFGVYLPLSAVPIVGAHAGGELAVQAFSWGEDRLTGAPAAQAHDFTFTIEAGQASPSLLLAAAEGKHYGEAVFAVRRPSAAGLVTTTQWMLTDVTVTSFSTSASQEQITLHFASLQEQVLPSGTPGGPSVTAGYDFQMDKEVSATAPGHAGSDVPAMGLQVGPQPQPGVALPAGVQPVVGAHAGGEIAVQGFSWAEHHPAGAPDAQPNTFTFTIEAGQASPALFLDCATGTHLANAVFTIRVPGPGGSLEDQVSWTLTDVVVSSFTTEDGHDTITLSFSKLEERFTPLLPNGSAGTPVIKSWDFGSAVS